jgi:predicted phosphate transport protein (TIGR00153 family)
LGKISFIPREQKFFELFMQSASNMVKAARALEDLLNNWENVEIKVAYITELEHEGDSITHQVAALLYRTFITPFDREDIAQLSHVMDDVTDFIHATAESISIYKIDSTTHRANELARIIVQAAVEVERAVQCLGKRSDLKNIIEHCVELNRLENSADAIYRAALGELFDDSKDTKYIIKWREIYDHMESATDRCEDVADVLEGVAMKNA